VVSNLYNRHWFVNRMYLVIPYHNIVVHSYVFHHLFYFILFCLEKKRKQSNNQKMNRRGRIKIRFCKYNIYIYMHFLCAIEIDCLVFMRTCTHHNTKFTYICICVYIPSTITTDSCCVIIVLVVLDCLYLGTTTTKLFVSLQKYEVNNRMMLVDVKGLYITR
jgi:hypothetical protein